MGSAPTQLTFLADSATAAIAPLKGSRETHLLLQSTEAATPENNFLYIFFCSRSLITAASDSGLKLYLLALDSHIDYKSIFLKQLKD